jgi:hypothetical protein
LETRPPESASERVPRRTHPSALSLGVAALVSVSIAPLTQDFQGRNVATKQSEPLQPFRFWCSTGKVDVSSVKERDAPVADLQTSEFELFECGPQGMRRSAGDVDRTVDGDLRVWIHALQAARHGPIHPAQCVGLIRYPACSLNATAGGESSAPLLRVFEEPGLLPDG